LVALELHLDPFFLEVGQQIIPINLALLLLKGVDDDVDEEVCNEQ
jgi:hypothetical protein